MVDIENILASLYAHEINVSLAWAAITASCDAWEPAPGQKKFRSSGTAVRCRQFPANHLEASFS